MEGEEGGGWDACVGGGEGEVSWVVLVVGFVMWMFEEARCAGVGRSEWSEWSEWSE